MPIVANAPSQELIDLVGALGGTWSRNSALCRCPAHDDRSPSLSVRQGDRGFLVHCYAGCDRSDIIRELARVVPTKRYTAPRWTDRQSGGNVLRLWDEGQDVRGSLAERYLKTRFLDPSLPDIRFHPRCPHGPAPLTKFKPALLVAIRNSNVLVAVQRIFLDPVTSNYTEKAMLGSPGQGAWQGTVARDTIAIAESFEDAAAYMAMGRGPCWTSLGAGRLHLLRFPASVASIVIAEDNDAEGRRAARRAWETYREQGLAVKRVKPADPHKDWAAMNAARATKEEGD
jgi:hypothetical protein